MAYNRLTYFLILILPIFAVACTGGYSFTGASIGEAQTIHVKKIPNRAAIVQPTLSNSLTEALKDRFVNQTSLELVNSNADLNFEGTITGYRVTPKSFQGNETAALNRLTISVKIEFTNSLEPDKNFESSFSRYADFESSQSLSSVEESLIDEIVEQLTEDIFNKAVVNW